MNVVDDLIAKLDQIEEQAHCTLTEFPLSLTKERQRMIGALVRFVRGELQRSQAGDPRQARSETNVAHVRSA